MDEFVSNADKKNTEIFTFIQQELFKTKTLHTKAYMIKFWTENLKSVKKYKFPIRP